MSNNGDLKQEGPPTLFKSESETDEAGHTRILASLEGRVSANGKAPKKSGRRYGVAAAIAVLVAGVGAWVLLNPTGESAPAQVAEQAAPAAAQAPAATQSAAAQADTAAAPPAASAPVVAVASEPAADMQPATIVNVTPSDEHAIDKLGKAPHAETTVSHAAAAKSANTDEGKTATAKLVAKSTDTPFKPLQATKTKAQSPAKSARNRKGTLAPDDPDADLLAALLAPQNAANKVINPPNSKGQ
jgi:hypothetical protein